MLQREIGNAKVTPPGVLPRKGDRIRDFSLPCSNGSDLSLSDFRGRQNLVLLFAGRLEDNAQWLERVLPERVAIDSRNATPLVVAVSPSVESIDLIRMQRIGAEVLCDSDALFHRAMGSMIEDGSAPAVYIADRFGEIVAFWRSSEGQPLPDPAEILSWLDYIENICPECEPPEWPLD